MRDKVSASLSVFYMACRGVTPRTSAQPLTQCVGQIIEAGLGVELWLSEHNYAPLAPQAVEELRSLVKTAAPVTAHTNIHTWVPDELRSEITFASSLSATCLVVHPNTFGLERCETPPRPAELRDICAFAKGNGVTLALENSGRTGIGMLRRAVDAVGAAPESTGMGICIDTGHANRARAVDVVDTLAYLEEFRDLIVEVHVNDNEGVEDLHLTPGVGTLDWSALLPAIRSLPRDPVICLEITSAEDPVRALLAARDYVCG